MSGTSALGIEREGKLAGGFGAGSAHQRTFAPVYVAHTGYHNADGSPNYGLFAGSYISAK